MIETEIYWDKYKVGGTFGCWLKRNERGVRIGDVRFLAGKIMYAYNVWPRGLFRAPEVNWCAVEDGKKYSMDDIRAWIKTLSVLI